MNVEPLYISIGSWEYLVKQCGDLPAGTIEDWVNNYNGKLRVQLRQIEDHIPFPRHVLDIGSGLGGIDALLIKRTGCLASLVDGEDAQPEVVRHDVPFCARPAVDLFMRQNEIDQASYSYYNPQQLPNDTFDLVISFASWCFHYAPQQYLVYVQEHTEKGSIIMVDMRRDRPAWRAEMDAAFGKPKVIENGKKHDRVVYARK